MRKISIIISLLALVGCLSSLRVNHYDGSTWDIDIAELQNSELVCFETVRDKEGKQLRENWEGISLLPWLETYAKGNWHSLQVVTNDGYVLKFGRLELKSNTAYLALKQEGKLLSDYDIRIIIPSFRESKWPRNLASINLLDLKPMLTPRQIFVWDNSFHPLKVRGHDCDTFYSLEMLMRDVFVQVTAELIFVDKQKQIIRLRYPEDLAGCSIIANQDNKLHLAAESSAENQLKAFDQLDEIIYLQCGPIAFIRKTALRDITELGSFLGWDWQGRELREYKQKGKKYKGGNMKTGSWLELG